MVVNIPPKETVELWGQLSSKADSSVRILPRTEDWLPEGMHVECAELVDCGEAAQRVHLSLSNSSRAVVTLKANHVLAELHQDRKSNHVLEAVVGPCCETTVSIDGVNVTGLVDSGSQVTVIAESFYRNNLSHHPLEQLTPAIDIVGAGGQAVPYLGVVAVTLALPKEVGGTTDSVNTYAVVCPDTKLSARAPVIVGTNTLRLLAKACDGKTSFPMRCEVAFAYQEASGSVSGRLCPVRLLGHGITIQPHDILEVRGVTRRGIHLTRDAVLVQEPTETALPAGLKVLSSKAPAGSLPRVRVTLCNDSDEVIKVKSGRVIADLFTIQEEYALANVIQQLHAQEEGDPNSPPAPGGESTTTAPDDLKSRLRFGDDADATWQEHFTARLLTFADVFNLAEFDIGKTDVVHDIDLTPGPAIRDRPRPVPPQDLEELRQHIQQLLDANIIKPSTSPFASPIVLVRKKNGSLRMCVDYRKINARTVRDSYALPKIEDLFMTLGKSQYFTSLDLSKAYYQVPLSERAKKISAFVTPFGLYEFERLSFGLVNAPMTFQRLMEQCFRDMNLVELIIFLDDLLVHAETLEELEERTIKVLQRLRRYKLKLDPDKCVFCAKEVKHLGFLISGKGLRPDPEKVEALTSWPIPKTVREVKAFIGFSGYYRRHVSHFSHLVKPLHDLTAGYIPRGTQKKGSKKGTLTLSSDISHLWTDVHQQAFEEVIRVLTSEPLLGVADKSRPFQLHCDASGSGLGAVLYQEQGGKTKVIAYASRGLNKTEVNYPAHKREFLALKWAMVDKFHDYLIGAKVTVVTDNNPLCYVLKGARLDATSHRWLAALSLYDFDLRYKRGPTHTDADGLSRRPQPEPEDDPEYQDILQKTQFILERAKQFDATISKEAVTALMTAKGVSLPVPCMKHEVYKSGRAEKKAKVWAEQGNPSKDSSGFIPAVEQLAKTPELIPDDVLTPSQDDLQSLSMTDWRKFQLADKTLKVVIDHVQRSRKLDLTTLPVVTPELRAYAREQDRLEMKDGVLHRRVTEDNGSVRYQLVVPVSHQKQAMYGVHEGLFHIHLESALQQARLRFFWPFMARDLERKIKKCGRCIRKGAKPQKAPMQSIETTFPLELLSIDYLTIEVKGQKQNILVVMDHFTKFGTALLTKDQTAKTVAKSLWTNFFMVYGFPKRILSDQGRDFESSLIKELCQVAGIQKCRTTPYHPAGNPVERWNRTLIQMLRSLEEDKKVDWRKSLPAVVHAYNCCIHSSTGYSPYFLFFGRHPRLPIDIAFGIDLDSSGKQSPRQYVKGLKRSLTEAYSAARQNMNKAALKNKARYDASAWAAELEEGDRVLIRRLGPRITGKVCDRWEKEIYRVLSKSSDIPVYTVQQENGQGPIRTLHRNLLLPIGALDGENQMESPQPHTTVRPSEDSKDVQTNSFEEEESGEEPCWDINIQYPPNNLRATAPEFIPRQTLETADDAFTQRDQESGNPEHLEESEAVPTSPRTEPTGVDSHTRSEEDSDQVEEQGVGVTIHPDMEPVHADVSSDEEEEVPAAVVESDTDESVPEVEEQRPPLRRSTRERRPVDRLNLTHVVQNRGDFEHWAGVLQSNRASMLESIKSVQSSLERINQMLLQNIHSL